MLQVQVEEVILFKLPFVTLSIFLAGVLLRTYRYLSVKLKVFPVFPKASKGVFPNYVKDVLFFRAIFSSDKKFWLLSWAFHASMAVIILGHLRMFLGFKLPEEVADVLGFSLGTIFLLTLTVLLVRRISRLRVISTAEDYFALLLLISVAISGMYLRVNGVSLDNYFALLLSGKTIEVESSALVVHALLAQILIAYLPFGKLFHSIGAFHSNYLSLRWKNARFGYSVRKVR